MEDLISIIVPVYNVEKYLDKCMNSIIDQTYKNLEIILIDDGSTDYSGKKCDEWANKDDRIKVIHKENGGLSDARNIGIENASGDYITFLDSDDCVRIDTYEILLKNLKQYNADVSACSAFDFFDENEIRNDRKDTVVLQFYKGNDVFQKLFFGDIGNAIVAWNKLYCKKIFENNLRFPKGKVHEDVFFAHRMLGEICSIVYTNEKLYYYRIRTGSISNTFNLKRLDELEGMQDRMIFFQQKRFENTEYPLLAILAYNDKLIRFYCYLKHYKIYHNEIKNIKQKFNLNYDKIMRSSISKKKKIKYMLFKSLPNIFYVFHKKSFMK